MNHDDVIHALIISMIGELPSFMEGIFDPIWNPSRHGNIEVTNSTSKINSISSFRHDVENIHIKHLSMRNGNLLTVTGELTINRIRKYFTRTLPQNNTKNAKILPITHKARKRL